MNLYIDFCQSVRDGFLGKTAQFWLSYMDHVSLVLALTRSVKANDFDLYAYSLQAMCDLFFSFGGQNYARFLTFVSVFVANLEFSNPGSMENMKAGIISVARSMIPGSRCAVDKTMEETFMKHAKSKGGAGGAGAGLCGLLKNFNAYQRWVRTTPERYIIIDLYIHICLLITVYVRVRYLEATHTQAGLLEDPNRSLQHKDLSRAEIKRSEAHVKSCTSAFDGFMNPFTIEDKSALYSISSGAKVPIDFETEILEAENLGKNHKEVFIQDRLLENSKFFDPIKKLKLKTMADSTKTTKIKTSQNKVVELKHQGNIAFQLLVMSQNTALPLDQVMTYQLTPIPYCLGTSYRFMNKTNKALGMKELTSDMDDCEQLNQERLLDCCYWLVVFFRIFDLIERIMNFSF